MRRTLTGLVLLLSLIVAATAQQAPKKVLRVAFVATGPSDYWKLTEAGVKAAADEVQAEAIFVKPKGENADEQLRLIDDLVSKKVDGMAACLLDFKKQGPVMAKLGKSMPLAFYNCDLQNTPRVLAVATDHKQGGRLAGQVLREALPKGATIALFTGSSQAAFSQERFKFLATELGIADPDKDTKSKDGKYRLLHREPVTDGVNPMQARDNIRQVLTRHRDEPNFCLVGLWGYHGPAILSVVKELNLTGKVTILAFEDEGDTLQGVDEGHIHATLVQNPQAMGYKVTQAILGQLRKAPVRVPPGGLEWIPHRVVTKTGEGGRVKAADLYAELSRIFSQ